MDSEAADDVALGVLIPVLAATAERGSGEALALLDQVEISSTDQEAKEHAEEPPLCRVPRAGLSSFIGKL